MKLIITALALALLSVFTLAAFSPAQALTPRQVAAKQKGEYWRDVSYKWMKKAHYYMAKRNQRRYRSNAWRRYNEKLNHCMRMSANAKAKMDYWFKVFYASADRRRGSQFNNHRRHDGYHGLPGVTPNHRRHDSPLRRSGVQNGLLGVVPD